MVQRSSAGGKNLWVAASDGDIERVKQLIEEEQWTPNSKDANSYTPMHAAASYAHIELLEYLCTKGGDINLADADGETPLFVVESVDVARWLIERGAEVGWTNEEGLTAADVLEEDHPEIATYLRSLTTDSTSTSTTTSDPTSSLTSAAAAVPPSTALSTTDGISQQALDNYTSAQSSALMLQAQEIMAQAEREGTDPDDKLRELVEKAVRDGLVLGGQLAGDADMGNGVDGEERKRSRE